MRNFRLKKLKAVLTAFFLILTLGVTDTLSHEVNKSAMVLLAAKDRSGKMFSNGTGFVVKPEGILITNYHVLVDAASMDAIFPDGSRVPVEGILKIDRIKDFAVLKLKEGFYSTLELGDSGGIRDFDYASALGYSSHNVINSGGRLKGIIVQTYGFVLGIHPQAYPDFPYIYTTAPFGPGFSGGPVVGKDNKVVGIATVEGRSINLALPINEIKPFLDGKHQMTLAQLFEKDRDSKEAKYYRGNYALYAEGNPDRAIRFFREVLAMDPNFVLAYYDLAVAHREKGRISESNADYEKVVEINPNFPEALSNLGGYYFREGKIEKAVELFKKALKIYPNFIQAHSNLGAALNKLNRPGEALPHLKKTLLLDPEFAIAYYNLGNTRFALGQVEEAQKAYNQAVRLGVDFLTLHWKLFETNFQQGKSREAERQLRIILKIDPQNPKARKKLAELFSPPHP
ncbi:MAG: tetratricopeptide repeat protein [Nitrospinaceae bacterium]